VALVACDFYRPSGDAAGVQCRSRGDRTDVLDGDHLERNAGRQRYSYDQPAVLHGRCQELCEVVHEEHRSYESGGKTSRDEVFRDIAFAVEMGNPGVALRPADRAVDHVRNAGCRRRVGDRVPVRHLDVGTLVVSGCGHGEDSGHAGEGRVETFGVIEVGRDEVGAEPGQGARRIGVGAAYQCPDRGVRAQKCADGGPALAAGRSDHRDRSPRRRVEGAHRASFRCRAGSRWSSGHTARLCTRW
jgi:hypothetical protein